MGNKSADDAAPAGNSTGFLPQVPDLRSRGASSIRFHAFPDEGEFCS